jgi:hypothetical protein
MQYLETRNPDMDLIFLTRIHLSVYDKRRKMHRKISIIGFNPSEIIICAGMVHRLQKRLSRRPAEQEILHSNVQPGSASVE